jgi:hypothetical protein
MDFPCALIAGLDGDLAPGRKNLPETVLCLIWCTAIRQKSTGRANAMIIKNYECALLGTCAR